MADNTGKMLPAPEYVEVQCDYEYDSKRRKIILKQGEKCILLKKTNQNWWQVKKDEYAAPFYVPARYVKHVHNASLPPKKQPRDRSTSVDAAQSDSAPMMVVKPLPPEKKPWLVEKAEALKRMAQFTEEVNVDLYCGKFELRIAFVGKTGTGKSATGNTILGRKEFASRLSTDSVTRECARKETYFNRRKLVLVDTPGVFDTKFSLEEISREIGRCVAASSPGPHAVVLVLHLGRYTPEEKAAVEKIRDIFGNEVIKYMIILFTRKDDLDIENVTMEQHISACNRDLLELIEMCGHRYCAFNNRLEGEKSQEQVSELIAMIDKMVQKNHGRCYTNDMYIQAEEIVREREKELKRQYGDRFVKEIERLTKRHEEELRKLRSEMLDREDNLRKTLTVQFQEQLKIKKGAKSEADTHQESQKSQREENLESARAEDGLTEEELDTLMGRELEEIEKECKRSMKGARKSAANDSGPKVEKKLVGLPGKLRKWFLKK